MSPVSEKFAGVPVEEDTRILKQRELTLGGIDALYQKWAWDGIVGESLIFVAADVEGMTSDDITSLITKNSEIATGESVTFKVDESGYAFLNYGFQSF